MAEVFSILSTISFVIAGVCFALAVFFWFFFKIPTVMGDLSGRTARKSIAQMRTANEKASANNSGERKKTMSHGKMTAAMPALGRWKKNGERENERPETSLLSENQAYRTVTPETCLLDSEETVWLDPEATGALREEEETVPLDAAGQRDPKRTDRGELTMLEEVMLVYTDEGIE